MKTIPYIFIALFSIIVCSSNAQTVTCEPNTDFELGNFSNWSYYTGSCCPIFSYTPVISPAAPEFIITSGIGKDSCCNFPVVGEGIHSLKLGGRITGAYGPKGRAQKVSYKVHVPAGIDNYALKYRFAFVYQKGTHSGADASLQIRVIDSATGVLVLDNGIYGASMAMLAGAYAGASTSNCKGPSDTTPICKPWATQMINLSGFNGKTVIVEFTTTDCGQGDHYGYAYIDLSCGLFAIDVYPQCGQILLVAPPGYAHYEWSDSLAWSLYGTSNDSLYISAVSTAVMLIAYPYTGFGYPDTLYTHIYPGMFDSSVSPISGSHLVCVSGNTMLSNATAGGTWRSSNTSVATIAPVTGVISGIAPGTAVISYTSSAGCIATVTITAQPAPDVGVISGPGSVCVGSVISLTDAISGGIWSSGSASVAAISSTGVVTGVSPGSATISYTLTAACGSVAATKTVTVLALPDAGTISGPDHVCVGASVVLLDTVAGGIWSSNSVAASVTDSLVTGVSNGVATVSYTVINTCGTAIATHTITISSLQFVIEAAVSPVSCYGADDGSISVIVSGGMPPYAYVWSTAQTVPMISNLSPGNYTLNVREPVTQCMKDTTFTIVQPDSMTVSSTVVNDLCNAARGTIELFVMGGVAPYSYLWSNNATSDSLYSLHAGVYSVTVTDVYNCIAQHSVAVADSVCSNVVIHDVITPNGDGVNDVWVIESIALYPTSTVAVFYKSGDKVFEKKAYKNDWGGEGLPDGTYYYLIKLNSTNMTGGADTFTGSLLIKR